MQTKRKKQYPFIYVVWFDCSNYVLSTVHKEYTMHTTRYIAYILLLCLQNARMTTSPRGLNIH